MMGFTWTPNVVVCVTLWFYAAILALNYLTHFHLFYIQQGLILQEDWNKVFFFNIKVAKKQQPSF